MIIKLCQTCKLQKSILEFGFLKKKQVYRKQCKSCRSEYYYKNNIEIRNKVKIYKLNNKSTIKDKNKQYTINNKIKQAKYSKEYRQKNKDKIRIKANKIEKIRMKNDPLFRLRKSVSNSINLMLKNNNSSKQNKSIKKYLSYTIEELKIHIEALFSHPDNLSPDGKIWMTWENRGQYFKDKWNDIDYTTWKWQLDHIIPHSEFKYKDMECQEFRDCWMLSNLRPYSAKQNQHDGATKVRHDTKDLIPEGWIKI